MGKQVRAFNLDNDVGAELDRQAELLLGGNKSAYVNQLLREALERRAKENELYLGVAVGVGKAVATLLLVLSCSPAILVFL